MTQRSTSLSESSSSFFERKESSRVARTIRQLPPWRFRRIQQALSAPDRSADRSATRSTDQSTGVTHPVTGPIAAIDIVSRAIDALEPTPTSRVLQVGVGSGYATALLARLAGEVHAVDPDARRLAHLRAALNELGVDNVRLHCGDATFGNGSTRDVGRFDAILEALHRHDPPEALLERLVDGGRIVLPAPRDLSGRTGDAHDAEVGLILRRGDNFRRTRLRPVPRRAGLPNLLVAANLVSSANVRAALMAARRKDLPIERALLQHSGVSDEALARFLARHLGWNFGELTALLREATTTLFNLAPESMMRRHRFVPLTRRADRADIATSNPVCPLDLVRDSLELEQLGVHLVTPSTLEEIWRALETGRVNRYVSGHHEHDNVVDLLSDNRWGKTGQENQAGTSHADAASTAPSPSSADNPNHAPLADAVDAYDELLQALLQDVVAEEACDLLVSTDHPDAPLRLRLDGETRTVSGYRLSDAEAEELIATVKRLAEMDPEEARLPQGGRFERELGGRTYDCRIQTRPERLGEEMAIRLRARDEAMPTLRDLGLPARLARRYVRLAGRASGLILTVGPSDARTDATLRTGLGELARHPGRKIMAVDVAADGELGRGIEQFSTCRVTAFDTPGAIRAFRREAPDLIAVGELDSTHTARAALEATSNGHLVISTLRCPTADATTAFGRLEQLGIDRRLAADQTLGVLAQRRLPRICPDCRVEVEPNPALLADLFDGRPPEDFRAFRGRGCASCQGSGTRGQVVVAELLELDDGLRDAIAAGASPEQLRTLADRRGLVSLTDHALQQVEEGVVPLEGVEEGIRDEG